MRRALRQGTIDLKIVPVLCGSAFKNKGIQPLFDAVVDYLPAPNEIPPVQGINSKGEIEARPADEKAPSYSPGIQTAVRSICGAFDLYPGLFRDITEWQFGL